MAFAKSISHEVKSTLSSSLFAATLSLGAEEATSEIALAACEFVPIDDDGTLAEADTEIGGATTGFVFL
ncbi:MAG: hypothetical protein RR848_09525, partial [Oscillospiraceae bacterium]